MPHPRPIPARISSHVSSDGGWSSTVVEMEAAAAVTTTASTSAMASEGSGLDCDRAAVGVLSAREMSACLGGVGVVIVRGAQVSVWSVDGSRFQRGARVKL